MNNRSNMPSKQNIAKYWLENGLHHPYIEDADDIHICFACGLAMGTERAHIDSLDSGGSNMVDNLYLLCAGCHQQTEMMGKELFFEWLKTNWTPQAFLFQNLRDRERFSAKMNSIEYLKKQLEDPYFSSEIKEAIKQRILDLMSKTEKEEGEE